MHAHAVTTTTFETHVHSDNYYVRTYNNRTRRGTLSGSTTQKAHQQPHAMTRRCGSDISCNTKASHRRCSPSTTCKIYSTIL